jgi:hypothetical protein
MYIISQRDAGVLTVISCTVVFLKGLSGGNYGGSKVAPIDRYVHGSVWQLGILLKIERDLV